MILKYHSKAKKEFIKSAEYYEEQVVGLGNEFIREVENVLDVIRQYPMSGTKITSKKRRFLVSRFPYAIVYSVEDDLVKIFAIMDLRRKPGYWKARR